MIVHLHKQVKAVVVPLAEFNANVTHKETDSQVTNLVRGQSSADGIAPRLAKRRGVVCTASSPSSRDIASAAATTIEATRKRRKVLSPESTQALYCPYKRCTFLTVDGMPAVCNHIHYYHDFKFPKYDPKEPIYGIQMTGHGHIDLTSARKTVLPGMRLDAVYTKSEDDPRRKIAEDDDVLRATFSDRSSCSSQSSNDYIAQESVSPSLAFLKVEKDATGNDLVAGIRFYCPYVDCSYTSAERPYVYAHIRAVHDGTFPKIQSYRKFVFKDARGEIVRFDGNCQVPRNEKITLEYDLLDTQNRFFCPYERCTTSMKCRSSLFSHIRTYHDPDFPQTGPLRQPFTLQTASGEEVHLSHELRKRIPEGESLNVVCEVTDQDRNRWYCPYRICQSISYSAEGRLFGHIRERHQSDFPRMRPNYLREFKTLTGKKVDFSGDPRKMIDSQEKLTVVYAPPRDPLYKYRCPYKGCPSMGKERARLYKHIREVHTSDFPAINTRRGPCICLCARTKKRIILTSKEEQFMEDGDAIEIVYINEQKSLVDLFYCPYRDCTAGCFKERKLVFKHIQTVHDPRFAVKDSCDLPKIYIGAPEHRRIIDFTALFRGTVDPNIKLTWD